MRNRDVNNKKTGCLLPYRSKISRWVYSNTSEMSKTPPVWFVTSSELYRQSNSYFSIRATWAPGPPEYCITVRKARWPVLQFSPFIYCIIVSSVHWQYSVRTRVGRQPGIYRTWWVESERCTYFDILCLPCAFFTTRDEEGLARETRMSVRFWLTSTVVPDSRSSVHWAEWGQCIHQY